MTFWMHSQAVVDEVRVMMIRHVVDAGNVDERQIIRDPTKARHCIVVAGRIAELAGEIDPLTHLNLDYSEHRLTTCIIADTMVKGAAVRMGLDGFLWTRVDPTAYRHLGRVDLDERRRAWLTAQRRSVNASGLGE
jgi:hypothetical protein